MEIGFFMGLLGSVHCIGMCGPLVMALPIAHMKPFQKVLATTLYHIGKLTTYGVLGLLAGLFGKQIPFYNVQQHLSVVLGLIMLIYVIWVFYLHPKRNTQFLKFDWLNQKIVKALGYLFKKRGAFSFIWIGLLNGLLPCGMIYLALASSWASQSVVQSGLFMVLFGIGTMPALLLAAFGGQLLGFAFRQRIQKALPYILTSMGVLLILRGMNLGIPYISPILDGDGTASCHN